MGLYNVQTILIVNETSLRICCRTRDKINFDIEYDSGEDLYNVNAYLIKNHGLDVEQLLFSSGVYCDQLAELLQQAHKKALELRA